MSNSTNSSDVDQAPEWWSGAATSHYVLQFVIFGIDIFLRASIIVMLVALRHRQPVKSRYFTPLLVQVTWLVYNTHHLVFTIVEYAGVRLVYPTPAFLVQESLGAVRYVLTSVSFSAYSVHIMRYFALINISALQQRQYQIALDQQRQRPPGGGDGGASSPKLLGTLIRLMKFVLTPLCYWLGVLSPLLVFVPLAAVFLGLSLSGHQVYIIYMDGLYFVWLLYLIIVVGIPLIAILALDIVLHAKTIFTKCNGLYRFLIVDDPLLFRIEMIVYIVSGSWGIGTAVIVLFPSNTYAELFTQLIFMDVFFALYYLLDQFRAGGIVILAALQQVLLERRKYRLLDDTSQSKADGELGLMLQDKEGDIVFEQYARSEFSVENLLAWRAIQVFRSHQDALSRYRQACFAYQQFICSKSPFEVNIAQKQRDRIKDALFSPQSMEMSPVSSTDTMEQLQSDSSTDTLKQGYVSSPRQRYLPDELFEDIEKTLMLNLSDTFSRFAITAQYKTYKKHREYLKANLESKHFA